MKNSLLFLGFLLLFSCSGQKRKYQKGFYVNRVHHKTQNQKSQCAVNSKGDKNPDQENTKSKSVVKVYTGDKTHLAGADNKLSFHALRRYKTPTPPDTCDVLIFRDGSEISAKVFEISSSDIKYKRCDNPDGPSYITRKADLFMIKYANGTKEVMKEEKAAPTEMPSYEPRTKPRYERSKPKTDHPMASASLLLAILSAVGSFILLVYTIDLSGSESTFLIGGGVLMAIALVAFVLGRIALKDIKESDVYKGKGLAVPGTIISAIIMGVWAMILFIALLVLFM